jgi:hypothetical protein
VEGRESGVQVSREGGSSLEVCGLFLDVKRSLNTCASVSFELGVKMALRTWCVKLTRAGSHGPLSAASSPPVTHAHMRPC